MESTLARDRWLPKSVLCLRDYSLNKFLHDLLAGITVGLVALPLAMAFAIASGLTPQAGIYCAVVTGFLISALGGSTTQIGGPTGAFVVVIAGIVAAHGVEGLFMCTVMAGVILVIMGLTGMGTAVKFIPRPIVIGFTNGIAILIASTQVKDFFGLNLEKVPGVFWARMQALAQNFHTFSFAATALAVGTIVIIIVCRAVSSRIPGAIVALVLGTLTVWIFKLPVATIGSRFNGIPSGLPHFHIPVFRFDLIHGLLGPALTVAMLGAIESLMSAVVSDRMSNSSNVDRNDRHNPNVELVAQGIANVVSPMFGGLPATGAIARTATNIRSGAKTPVAGMIHALTLLAILLFASKLVSFVPMAVLAGILMVVSYNMGEWREIPSLLKLTKTDVSVWLVTFALTVFADLTVAVQAGMILAALLFIMNQGYWGPTLETLSLVIVAALVSTAIGVPVGIAAAHRPRLYAALRPVLDLMQTLPTFVYLIPTLVLFGLGVVPGLISTVIFALPAPIRLTQLGISSVPTALREAGQAFGATPMQLLWKVELPSAAPTILAGITQCIMLSLSMVVIAALVGAGGLGVPVVRALNTVQVGMGFEAGFVIVLLAIVLDRISRPADKAPAP